MYSVSYSHADRELQSLQSLEDEPYNFHQNFFLTPGIFSKANVTTTRMCQQIAMTSQT